MSDHQQDEIDQLKKHIMELEISIKNVDIECDHDQSDLAPCVLRDGAQSQDFRGMCITCEKNPAELLRVLARKYEDMRKEIA